MKEITSLIRCRQVLNDIVSIFSFIFIKIESINKWDRNSPQKRKKQLAENKIIGYKTLVLVITCDKLKHIKDIDILVLRTRMMEELCSGLMFCCLCSVLFCSFHHLELDYSFCECINCWGWSAYEYKM